MRALRSTSTTNIARAVWRLAGVFLTVALVCSIALGGTRYFFCAGMDRIHGEDTCCAPFEPSVEDIVRAEREAEQAPVAVGELEAPCCEARHHGVLPGAAIGAVSPPLEAPWVAVLPPPPPVIELASHSASTNACAFDSHHDTGPPPKSATAACARLSVFVL